MVSIIIPNYNGEKFLNVCLESLSKQTFKEYEIIMVDNASKDNSCNYIRKKFPEVKIIKLDKNYGFSRAVNEGIKNALGQYVVLLNNDTEATETWLESLVNAIESNEEIFSCCSKMIRYYDTSLIDDAGDFYNIFGWAYKRGDGGNINQYVKNDYVFSSCAGAAIYRRDIFGKIGYFDEEFFAYLEDIDISYRAKIYGYKNLYCSNAIIKHIGSATSGSKYNNFKVSLASRNNIFLIFKNMPILQIFINIPFLIIGMLIKQIFFSKKKFGRVYFKGVIDGITGLKNIKKVQFKFGNINNYIKIEIELIFNLFRYVLQKIR